MRNKVITYKLWATDGHILVVGRQAYLDNGRLPYRPQPISRQRAAEYLRAHRYFKPGRGL